MWSFPQVRAHFWARSGSERCSGLEFSTGSLQDSASIRFASDTNRSQGLPQERGKFLPRSLRSLFLLGRLLSEKPVVSDVYRRTGAGFIQNE